MIRIGLSDQLGQTKRFFPSVIAVLALLVIALVAVFNLFDHNDVGYATVVQFPNGSIRVVTEPGIFFQGFGKMTVYKTANDTLAFSKDPEEGKPGDTSIPVRFRDGGQGKVTIDVTFKLPEDKESLGRIHTDWHSYEQLERGLVRPQVNNVIQLTATKLSSSTAPPVVFNGATSGGKGGAENLYPLLMMKMLSEQVGVNPKPER